MIIGSHVSMSAPDYVLGSVKEASAPGQIEVGKLKEFLTAIHENL